jgi:hypothetical protein
MSTRRGATGSRASGASGGGAERVLLRCAASVFRNPHGCPARVRRLAGERAVAGTVAGVGLGGQYGAHRVCVSVGTRDRRRWPCIVSIPIADWRVRIWPRWPAYLRRCGYRTVCVHPYAASFYARDKVYPRLGFDEFIDIRSFSGAPKSGPYVSDLAVAEKVCSLLAGSSEQPLFVFVITMENHGPLHLEDPLPGDSERCYTVAPAAGCDDLTIYLRHLRNADSMAGRLRQQLAALPGNGCLCWFGDHVPILPEVYRAIGTPDGQTDYFIWRKDGPMQVGTRRDLKVEQLGDFVLQAAGVFRASATEASDQAPGLFRATRRKPEYRQPRAEPVPRPVRRPFAVSASRCARRRRRSADARISRARPDRGSAAR